MNKKYYGIGPWWGTPSLSMWHQLVDIPLTSWEQLNCYFSQMQKFHFKRYLVGYYKNDTPVLTGMPKCALLGIVIDEPRVVQKANSYLGTNL